MFTINGFYKNKIDVKENFDNNKISLLSTLENNNKLENNIEELNNTIKKLNDEINNIKSVLPLNNNNIKSFSGSSNDWKLKNDFNENDITKNNFYIEIKYNQKFNNNPYIFINLTPKIDIKYKLSLSNINENGFIINLNILEDKKIDDDLSVSVNYIVIG